MDAQEVIEVETVGSLMGRESLCDERLVGLDGLFRNHHLELVRHVYQRVHSWSDAHEIVQQTYFNLVCSRGRSAVTNVRAYLFKMAANLAYDWNRKRVVRDSFAREAVLRAVSQEVSAEEICEHREELEHLLEQVDNLPQQCRTALLLVRHEGMSIEEAATRMEIKPKSVRVLLSRAMKYLLATVPNKTGAGE